MGLHVFWPASAILTLFVVGVIMILIKFGPRLCRTRHTPLPTDQDWEGMSYEHEVSVSVA